jgi:hypothetical protein
MPIAKEQLKVGFVVVANPGTYVSKQAVKDNGWEKLVDDGPDLGGEDEAHAKKAPKAS